MYEYEADLVRVVDGDTVRFKVDLGFAITTESNFRLLGIDAPEVRGAEREEGLKSADALTERITGKRLKIKTTKPDKYGRWLCIIFAREEHTWVDVNDWMVKAGHAKEYGK